MTAQSSSPSADETRVEEIFRSAVTVLEGLCAISSPSGDREGLERMASALGAELGRRGLAVEAHRETDREGRPQPMLVARGPAGGEGYLLLIGHLDTVLPAIPPRRGGGRLDGTGALDMKGGFAALIGALDLLAARGLRSPEDLVLVAVPDEEVGGVISERAVHAWGRDARAVLVLEPGERRPQGETLVVGRRGLVEWRLEARGVASHSGLAYWEGRSAIAAAASWSARAQALSEPGRGPTVNVARLVGGDTEFVDGLDEHHDLVGTTRRLNIVADRAVAEGEVRFLTVGDRDRLLAELECLAGDVAAESGVLLTLTRGAQIPPVDPTGPGREIARRAVAHAAAAGWSLELEDDRGGVSFPNFLPDPGAVPVLDGLGPVGGGMHTRSEHVELLSLKRRIVLLADLLADLAR